FAVPELGGTNRPGDAEDERQEHECPGLLDLSPLPVEPPTICDRLLPAGRVAPHQERWFGVPIGTDSELHERVPSQKFVQDPSRHRIVEGRSEVVFVRVFTSERAWPPSVVERANVSTKHPRRCPRDIA